MKKTRSGLQTTTRIFGLLAVMVTCTTFMCCGLATNLRHLHSAKQNAVIVPLFGQVTQDWYPSLYQAFADTRTDVVIAWMESGGGSVTEVRLLDRKIKVLRAAFPAKSFYTFSEYLIASGAYWLACTADSIFLAPTAYCGSIGVIYTRIDSTRADSIAGVKYHIIHAGNNKAFGNSHYPITLPEVYSAGQEILNIYNIFLETVLHSRGERLLAAYDTLGVVVPFETYILYLEQGDVFGAEESKAFGLADEVLWFDGLIQHLSRRGLKVSNVNGLPVSSFHNMSNSLVHKPREIYLEIK